MLSNLETEKSKLLQIVLVGQPNLRDKLATAELEQLRQRITVSYHLSPLDEEETANYINYRLRRASVGAPIEFPREATSLIHTRSRGVPRIVNIICDAALVFGYAEERRQVDQGLIVDVLAELETTGVLPNPAESDAADAMRIAPAASEVSADAPPPATRAAASSPIGAANATAAERAELKAAAAAGAAPAAHSPGRVLDARNWPPAPARPSNSLSDEARSTALEQREQIIRQRERELAEQRRVLAEEYRLLRQQRHHSVSAPTGTMGRAATRAADDGRRIGLWARLKRIMLGVSA